MHMEPHHERRVYAGCEVMDCKYADCTSTNEVAALLVHDASMFASHQLSAPIPVVVSAGYQTKGRGRRGNVWEGRDGENLYLSIALPAPTWTNHYPDYQILGCMAVVEALRDFINPEHLHLKYPNDVMIDLSTRDGAGSDESSARLKVCGVLVETEFRGSELHHVVCGIGVNVNQRDFSDAGLPHATSLRVASGREVDVDAVRAAVVEHFFRLLTTSADELYRSWVRALGMEGRRICTTTHHGMPSTHIVMRVERDGTLRVRDVVGAAESDVDHLLSFYDTSFRVCEDNHLCCAHRPITTSNNS